MRVAVEGLTEVHLQTLPAQIRTCGIIAYGSSLEYIWRQNERSGMDALLWGEVSIAFVVDRTVPMSSVLWLSVSGDVSHVSTAAPVACKILLELSCFRGLRNSGYILASHLPTISLSRSRVCASVFSALL